MPRRAAPDGHLLPLASRRVAPLDTGDVGEGERPSVCRDPPPEWAHGGVGVGHFSQQQPCRAPRDGSPATGVIVTLVNPKVLEVDSDAAGMQLNLGATSVGRACAAFFR